MLNEMRLAIMWQQRLSATHAASARKAADLLGLDLVPKPAAPCAEDRIVSKWRGME